MVTISILIKATNSILSRVGSNFLLVFCCLIIISLTLNSRDETRDWVHENETRQDFYTLLKQNLNDQLYDLRNSLQVHFDLF